MRAHALDQIIDLVGRPLQGSSAEEIDDELREAGLALRILPGPRGQREARVEQRQAAALDGDQLEPARKLLDRERRKLEVAHAAPPTAAALSSGSASGSSPGKSVTTLRRWGAKKRRAAFCTSAAVTLA